MCIVIDPPLFVPLFKSTDPEHLKFAPVLKWINESSAKFVLGGTDYATELRKISSVLASLAELERRGKIHRGSNASVDAEQKRIQAIEPSPDFDDAHLVALTIVSGCKLVCTRDQRAHKYLRDARFYARSKDRPKIYTRVKNTTLLCRRNMCRCCS